MTFESMDLPDPDVSIEIEYSGLPPYADKYGMNWYTCLDVTLVLRFPISETAEYESRMPAIV